MILPYGDRSGEPLSPSDAEVFPETRGLGREIAGKSAFLPDGDYLKRGFKDIGFPATRESILRCVDQERDFAQGTAP